MKAEIIAVGTEMLMGQIVNTNAPYIARQLNALGIEHYWETVVGDNPERLVAATAQAEDRSDILIYTGGIGPTRDDLTKQVVSAYLKEPLVKDAECVATIKRWLTERKRPVSENNLQQALMFANGVKLENPVGQAIGTALTKQQKTYLFLPGFPNEMKVMFETAVIPYLRQQLKETTVMTSRYLNYFDIGEAQLAQRIDQTIMNQTNPTLAIYASGRTVTVRLTARGETEAANAAKLDQLSAQLNQILGDYFYAEGLNTYPNTALVTRLRELQQTISFCESLTGGLASDQVVQVPGASQIFRGGLVTYDALAKEQLAHVDPKTIATYGMVSAECSREMALGAQQQLGTDFALSFTGVAGPDQMENQPVGSVYIGLAGLSEVPLAFHYQWQGTRAFIRQRAVDQAFILLLTQLAGRER